ncbi:gamma-glutamyltransferase [Candidatus Dormiibacter inghamiae]|uniref:gamma-glutamyltransferase family protein n=1 Tax=Candidatus Dormiibacter inghamiae TaxID=3127013 RepID=UPI0030C69CEE
MRSGGNAIDAAIAANAVLCVVYPHMTAIGGDLFALIWPAGAREPIGLAGAGRSGSLASWQALRNRGLSRMPQAGSLTVTVPGTVEAWGRLLERFGSLGFAPLLTPAASLARDGFLVTRGLAQALVESSLLLGGDPESARLLPPLRAGMLLRSQDLAESLDAIGRSGFSDFYRGAIAARIVAALEGRGGLITAEDLAQHRSAWVQPVAFRYRDLVVYEMPPPTQGLAAAGLIRRLEAAAQAPALGYVQALQRARDAVYPLRDSYITDPDFSPTPEAPFLELEARGWGPGDALPEGDTIYLCTADEYGNVVSLIQSLAGSFGSGIVAEGTGVLLQNRGSYFSLEPSHVNRLEPGKRTMHTLIPALAGREGSCWAAFGTMGADGQPQIQAQVWQNLADRGLSAQEAVARPRVRVASGGQQLWLEADHPAARQLLRSGAGGVQVLPPGSSQLGHAQALVRGADGGWQGGADPRADGSVVEV